LYAYIRSCAPAVKDSKQWRNLGLALVFTTKVQWSIAEPKKKACKSLCVYERDMQESQLERVCNVNGDSLALCRTHESYVETSTRRQAQTDEQNGQTRRIGELGDGRSSLSAFFLSCNFCVSLLLLLPLLLMSVWKKFVIRMYICTHIQRYNKFICNIYLSIAYSIWFHLSLCLYICNTGSFQVDNTYICLFAFIISFRLKKKLE